ncbi:hypothetical protein K1T71_007432 [Dendrolimus kikuchii]|uniref:Uncharacterized protein n=1 Tax=Dendrolimus kikuchii TaxID=765133 RepID=A0ACC1D0K5_9NEOP|nr:hypothetical protein K1T71_007432 [Dendrolimus kikuchii]
MEGVRIQNKIKLLFEKIVEPNYEMNNYYVDGLINKLSNCTDPEISFLGAVPLLSDLICEALKHIDNAHISVKVFVTRILAITSRKELHFTKIMWQQGSKILEGFKEINSPSMCSSLRVAYLEVALGIVNHNSGISWLLETGLWKEILSLCNEKRTVFVVRKTYKFAANFLWRLNDLVDCDNTKMVLSYILRPATEVDFLTLQSLNCEEDERSQQLEPMLHMLLATLNTGNRISTSNILVNIMIKDYNLISLFCIILDTMRNEEISVMLAKILFWLVVGKTFNAKPIDDSTVYTMVDFLDLRVIYFNTIQFFIKKRYPLAVLDYCIACNMIWITACGDKDVEETSVGRIKFKNQLLFMCLVPLVVFVTHRKSVSAITNDSIHDYVVKLLNIACEHTAKAAYSMAGLIEELDTLPIIIQAIKKLSCLKQYLSDEQANLIFQALFYILKEYDPIDDYGVCKQEQTFIDNQEKELILTYVMDMILVLVKKHNISWHESLEVLCLYSVVFNILKRPNLSSKFIVTSLNVIAVSIKKFLPPNLSLLLDSKPGSSMHELGKLMYMKMHDLYWEVRDSALELLHVCTEISYIKFPPFQNQIMENNLINVAATIALNDFESYVQVSALKCIGAASKISSMWDQLITQYPDIQDQLISILRNNQEGIVRKEACNVLCDIYQNLKLTPHFKQSLYEHMVSSALSDFHWEVQYSALKFWKVVYQSLLNDQGMLDGVFPPVTFSRQSRKIVTLNEMEIQRRLMQMLDELASIGSLTVFIILLHDDSDLDIMDTALTISLELIDILDRYKLSDQLKPKPGDPMTVKELTVHIKEEKDKFPDSDDMFKSASGQTADNVIEGILNVDDVNLLTSIYERHMSLQNNKTEATIKPKIKLLRFASPYLFVRFVKGTDFKAIIEEKRKWNVGIRSVSSLLDDVLGIYEVNGEVNALDCY